MITMNLGPFRVPTLRTYANLRDAHMTHTILTNDDAPIIAAMPAAQAQVLAISNTGKSMVEIADIMGVPLGTVKSRLHRARARIDAARKSKVAS